MEDICIQPATDRHDTGGGSGGSGSGGGGGGSGLSDLRTYAFWITVTSSPRSQCLIEGEEHILTPRPTQFTSFFVPLSLRLSSLLTDINDMFASQISFAL